MINTPQAPYFDDFDIEKNFLKILFKPKLSVQTRELEQMQSMFQNQVETLASQIFQNGSVVSGGKFTFKEKVDYVKLYSSYNSQTFNYEIYKDRYVYGTTTKIMARVFSGWNETDNEVASLYLDYLNSGENQEQTFQPSEVIQLISHVYLTKITGDINIGDHLQGIESGALATVVNINNNEYDVIFTSAQTFTSGEQVLDTDTSAYYLCTATESTIYKAQIKSLSDDEMPIGNGSAVYVDEGIYYVDGYFVHTDNQVKIISNYTVNTNARVGFEKEVQIITCDEDHTLFDNANGYPNYNAPGADRLKLNLILDYYNLFETPSDNFVEVLTIENSTVTGNSSINQKYSEILDTLARRTYDESGNYTVKPFLIDVREFLDDGENNGIYKAEYFGYNTQQEALNASMKIFKLTAPGSSHIYGTKYYPYPTHPEFLSACKDRLAVGIEPGKAYVMGYEIENPAKIWVPTLKARDTKVLNNSLSSIYYGNYIKVNNVLGLPDIYHHQPIQLSSDSTFTANTNIIGTANVYAFEVESGTIGTTNCIYKVFLENIQMNEGKTFTTDVNSFGNEQTFSGKPIKDNNVITFNNIDNSALICPTEKVAVSGISDASYEYKRIFTGTVSTGQGGLGTFTIPADANSRFVDITDNKNYLLTILTGSIMGQNIDINTLAITTDSSGNLSFSGLPAESISQTYMIIATLYRTADTVKTKTLYSNVEYITNTGDYSEIILNHADGYKLVGIYESEDIETVPTTSDKNITDNYIFDNGQRDTYYDLARVILKEGAIAPTGQVLVVYDYFAHSAGDYFTVDSYQDQIDYEDIPSYASSSKVYDLKNCIDFRGRIDENGSGNFSGSTLPHIIQNNSMFQSDIEYYLPRLDILELDYKGTFNIKYGTSSDDPQYPIGSVNSMTLYYLAMPAYTESADGVIRIYCENKRYTMRDIGNLDNRITAVENYIMMNTTEEDTNNLQIYDANGYACVKTGFIVDIFINHDYGDIELAGYRCSIDPDDGVLRPDYKLHTIDLVRSEERQSTVVLKNGLYMIPYTTKPFITNTINTSYIPLNSNQLVEWVGNIALDTKLSTKYNPVGVTTINYGASVSSISSKSGSIWNRVKRSWIGSNTTFN